MNKLTPAEIERLTILMEECAEVIQAAGKVLRHGWDGLYPGTDISNRDQLEIELGDVDGIVNLMDNREDLNHIRINGHRASKSVRMDGSKYLHHQITDEDYYFQKYGHERHCNLMFPMTVNTEADFCDCKASAKR